MEKAHSDEWFNRTVSAGPDLYDAMMRGVGGLKHGTASGGGLGTSSR